MGQTMMAGTPVVWSPPMKTLRSEAPARSATTMVVRVVAPVVGMSLVAPVMAEMEGLRLAKEALTTALVAAETLALFGCR